MKKHFHMVEAMCLACKTKTSFKWRFDLKRHLNRFHTEESVVIKKHVYKGFEVHVAVAVQGQPQELSPTTSKFLALVLN